MATEEKSADAPKESTAETTADKPEENLEDKPEEKPWLQPLSANKRRRLQETFLRAITTYEKYKNLDYAPELFAACVAGDPTNMEYTRKLFECLHEKYSKKKKAGTFGALMSSGPKGNIKKAKASGDWPALMQAGVNVLIKDPYDAGTLLAMSDACKEMESDECELFYLKQALDTNPKDPSLNKTAALVLADHGLFSDAIACWHRVEEAKPEDPEAIKMIGELTVQRAMPKSEYDQKVKDATKEAAARKAKADRAAGKEVVEEEEEERVLSPAEKLVTAIKEDPTDESNYLDLAGIFAAENKYDKALKVMDRALQACSSANLRLRQHYEEFQIAGGRHKIEVAEQRARSENSEKAKQLVKKLESEQNRMELEIYAARCDRTPGHENLHYELGVRLKRAKRFDEAITNLQKAQGDPQHRAQVQLELGECFQCVKRYPLAMRAYERAIEYRDEKNMDSHKLSLYRAGALALSLYEKVDPPSEAHLESAEKHLTELAGIDFAYRNVAALLDKVDEIRNND